MRARQRSGTAISSSSPSRAAWRVRDGDQPVQARDRGWAALAHRGASGHRDGRSGPRAQPHAGPGTPELCPHRLTVDGVGVNAPAFLIRATQPRTFTKTYDVTLSPGGSRSNPCYCDAANMTVYQSHNTATLVAVLWPS